MASGWGSVEGTFERFLLATLCLEHDVLHYVEQELD